jgi:NAD(P)-dependent dehydrogenase (short-subunit alcohol dehydrogenase family)
MSALDGKIALVTGAGRGIGRATAVELARAGARVAILARSRDELEETSEHVREIGGTALVLQADLGDLGSLPEVVQRVTSSLGSVQILINNAATTAPVGTSVSLDPAAWAVALHVNVVAPATLAFCLLPAMLDQHWGRVVNVSSGIVEEPGEMIRGNAYVTSKAALEAHTLNLAAELANTGVTVNVFRPGAVHTAMFAYLQGHPAMIGTPELHEWAVRAYAEGELITPADAARSLLAHLRTDASGQIWDVTDVL